MPKTRPGRFAFVLVACACLLVISRNLYHRYLNNALIDAVYTNNAAATRSLLDRGADANTVKPAEDPHWPDLPLLSIAAGRALNTGDTTPQTEIALLLAAHGAKARRVSMRAPCQAGNVALLRCLLEHGASVDPVSSNGGAALDDAIGYGQTNGGLALYTNVLLTVEEQAQRRRISREMIALLLAHGARPTLFQAAQMEDVGALRTVLAAGADVNRQDQYGRLALSLAAERGGLSTLQTLLTHGADVNLKDRNGDSALNWATGYRGSGDSVEAVRLLLAHGANVNNSDKRADTPLITAIVNKHADIARLLLAHHADPNLKRTARGTQYSALSAAALYLPALIPELLTHGADVNGDEGAALKEVIRAHNPDTARYLLQHGAKIYPPISKVGITTASAMPGAVTGPHPQIVTLPSTLRVAVTDGPECFDLLMQAGADITPDKPDILLAAASAGHAALFDRLIALGANVNAVDTDGNTPLTKASLHAPNGIRTLIEHGANPNIVAQPEQMQALQTPLIMAVQRVSAETVRLLLAHGADVNLKPLRSHTALYFARRHKTPDTDIVKMLTQAGAKDE